jgi:hypothetical protein
MERATTVEGHLYRGRHHQNIYEPTPYIGKERPTEVYTFC